jgi:hypothetical protein
MDFPLPRRKPTWRDSPWWLATEQSMISGAIMMLLASPIMAYMTPKIMRLANLEVDALAIASDFAKGGLLMMPYLWTYYFALERIARQRRDDYSPSIHER